MNILNLFKKPAPAPEVKTVESITASVVTMVAELEALAAEHEAAYADAQDESARLLLVARDAQYSYVRTVATAEKFRALVSA